ncbi:MAG TPA: hexokinase [Candidatus Scatomorpha intestinavium]|uniref:Hexokinase n=1 Tax=Candidatus Scatomorpha intestinavium TaxID=2840922 RepID=A0A9D1CSE5_9FIRM|nr:hexokinase [Candidatus Scatomorpha intestinavium]
MNYSDKVRVFLASHGMEPDGLDLEECAARFIADMELGLAGLTSSLDMIPTYLTCGVPAAGSKAAVIDAGGTNFRVALVAFTESGPVIERMERYAMPGSDSAATWEDFISFSAEKLLPFLDEAGAIGFCFSYRAEVTPERDGRVIAMSKAVQLAGCEGRLVCADLLAELRRRGAPERSAVIVNDTAAVMLSGSSLLSGGEYDGLVGLVCGTGQNTCCAIDPGRIRKLGLPAGEPMIVNLESGCFDGLPRGDFDRELDAASTLPGDHLLEKMTSGAYLGELCRLTLRGAAADGLFSPAGAEAALGLASLSSAEADALASGAPGGPFSEAADAETAAELCMAVYERAAACIAVNLASILLFTGAGHEPDRPACICADGSTIVKSRCLRPALEGQLRSFAETELGLHAVIHTSDEAPVIGTAAAALLNVGK